MSPIVRLLALSTLLAGVLASPAPAVVKDPGQNLPGAARLAPCKEIWTPQHGIEIANWEEAKMPLKKFGGKSVVRRHTGAIEGSETTTLLDKHVLLNEKLLDKELLDEELLHEAPLDEASPGHLRLEHAPHTDQESSEEPMCPVCAKHMLDSLELEEEEASEGLGHSHSHEFDHSHKDKDITATAADATLPLPGSAVVDTDTPTREQEPVLLDESQELSGGDETNADTTTTETATATSTSTRTGLDKTSTTTSATSTSASGTATGTAANSAGVVRLTGALPIAIGVMGVMVWM